MTSVPPQAIIERAKDECIRSLPFWTPQAQREGVWSKTESRIDGSHYWLIAVRCAARPHPVILGEPYWTVQEQFESESAIIRPDRFVKFVPAALMAGVLSFLFFHPR